MPAPPSSAQRAANEKTMTAAREGTSTAGSNTTTKTGAGYKSPAASASKDSGNFSGNIDRDRQNSPSLKGGIQQGTEKSGNFGGFDTAKIKTEPVGSRDSAVPVPRSSPFKIETARGWQDLWQPSDRFDEDLVDQDLLRALKYGAFNSETMVSPFSGQRPKGKVSSNHWGSPFNLGDAIDVNVLNHDTGAAYPNYQSPENFRTYEDYAQAVKRSALKIGPSLDDIRWGGYFGGELGRDKYGKDKRYGAQDLMHFDTDKLDLGMGGGSWEGGMTPSQQALSDAFRPGAKSVGMGGIGETDVARKPNLYDTVKPVAVDAFAGAKKIASNLFGQDGTEVSPPIPQRKPTPPAANPKFPTGPSYSRGAPLPYDAPNQSLTSMVQPKLLGVAGRGRNALSDADINYFEQDNEQTPQLLGVAGRGRNALSDGDINYFEQDNDPGMLLGVAGRGENALYDRDINYLEQDRELPASRPELSISDARKRLEASMHRELAERGFVNENIGVKPPPRLAAGTYTKPYDVPPRQAAGTPLDGYDETYNNPEPLPSLSPNSDLLNKVDRASTRITDIPVGPAKPWVSSVPSIFAARPDYPFDNSPDFEAVYNDKPRALGVDKYGDTDGIMNVVGDDMVQEDEGSDVAKVPTADEVLMTRELNKSVLEGEPTTIEKLKKIGGYAKDAIAIIGNPVVGIPTVAGRRAYAAIKDDMEKLAYLKKNYPATYTAEIARRQKVMADNAAKEGDKNGNKNPTLVVNNPSTDQSGPSDNDEGEDVEGAVYAPPAFKGLPSDIEHYGERAQHRYYAGGGRVPPKPKWMYG